MASSSSPISELIDGLDAATYFFVSSGIVVGLTAALFFTFGVWLGRLLWGRYKRRLREANDIINAFKGEVAQLKRRIAEQATRPLPSMGAGPLQSIAGKTPAAMPALVAAVPAVPAVVPPSRAFSLWTEPQINVRSDARERGLDPTQVVYLLAPTAAQPEAESLPLPPLEVFMVPRSRALSLWTAPGWKRPAIQAEPLRPGMAFSLWTRPDFIPACRGPLWRSTAFTLWTTPGWAAPRISNPPPRSARSFSIWTEAGWKPQERLPWSKAFSVWTEDSWSAAPVKPAPLPASAACALWTMPGYEPACRGPLHRSLAHAVWTERNWAPVPVKAMPVWPARPFSIWAENPADKPAPVKPKPAATRPAVAAAVTSAVAAISAETSPPAHGRGLIARALAAAKNALGLREGTGASPAAAPVASATPVQPSEAAPIVAPSPVASAAPVPESALQAQAAVAPPAAGAKEPAPRPDTEPTDPTPISASTTETVAVSADGTPPPVKRAAAAKVASKTAKVPASSSASAAKKPAAAPQVTAATPPAPDPAVGPPLHPPAPLSKLDPVLPPEPGRIGTRPPHAVTATLASLSAAVASVAQPVKPSAPEDPPAAQPVPPPPARAFTLWTADAPTAPQEQVAQRPALASFIESKVSGNATSPVPPVPASPPAAAAAPKSDPPLAIPAVPAIKTTRVPAPKPRDLGPDLFAPDPAAGRHDYQLGFVYTQEPAQKDALTALGLDETMRQLLHNNGIYTFRQIALWTDAQSEAFAQRLGIGDRIRREKWRDQARALHAKLHGESL